MHLRALSVAGPGLLAALVSCTTTSPETGAEVSSSLAGAGTGYRFELVARGSEEPSLPAGSYRVPVGVFLKNMTPSLNDRGDVALDFMAWDGLQHIWKNGAIIHDVPDPSAVVSVTSLGANGDVAFDVMGGAAGNGVFVYSEATHETSFLTSEPLGADGWMHLRLLDDGRVGFRAGGGGRRFVGTADADGFRRIALEAATSPTSPYEYLFAPEFDGRGNAAFKVMLAAGGEEIRFFKPGAAPAVLVQTQAVNPSSPYTAIDNGIGLSDDDQVAFIAKSEGRRGVYRIANGETVRVAVEGENDVQAIAYFTPVLNATGLVVFKGEDSLGRNAIWMGDGRSLRRLATTGDALPSDKGEAVALPEVDLDPTNRVVFGGGLAINARGDILFSAALAQHGPHGTERLGTAIYVARADAAPR